MNSENTKKTIKKIYCGLENDFGIRYTDKLVWPVAKAHPCSIKINQLDFTEKFSLLFSSKTAVYFFYHNLFQHFKDLFLNCVSVYCVGEKTHQYFIDTFHSYHLNSKLFFSKKMGIEHLLDEYSLENLKEHLVVITGTVGKTTDVINHRLLKDKFTIYSVYALQPYQSNFLDTLEISKDNHDIPYVYEFECYSGQIYQFTAQFLMQYFKCESVSCLPNFIQLKALSPSAKEAEREFYEK